MVYLRTVGAAALLALALALPARSQTDSAQLDALVQKLTPSVATVRLVVKAQVKSEGQSSDHESKMRMQGVVVSPDGLVMLSYAPFSNARWSQMAKDNGAPTTFSMSITPTSFKVVLDNDPKEYDAFLAATDTKLDLAFVQVEGLGAKKLPAIDFGTGVEPTLGQELAVVSRLKKGYDFAPYFSLARTCSVISKPRKAWMLDGNITEMGLPIFTLSGQVVGVLTSVASGAKDEDDEDDGPGGFGMSASGSADGGVFVVPASAVKGVIDQAVKRAVQVAADRAAGKTTTPPKEATTPPKTTTPPKGAGTPPAKPKEEKPPRK